MKNKPAPEYQGFYNQEALKLIDWMYAEDRPSKRAMLYQMACKLEHRYRRHHPIPPNSMPTGLWMMDPTNQPPIPFRD